MDDFWNKFWSSGSVDDYLNYKENENEKVKEYDNLYQGLSDKGTDNRGE